MDTLGEHDGASAANHSHIFRGFDWGKSAIPVMDRLPVRNGCTVNDGTGRVVDLQMENGYLDFEGAIGLSATLNVQLPEHLYFRTGWPFDY